MAATEETTITEMLPIRLTSKIIRGFNRGSKDLGIPTANLCREESNQSFDDLPCGIYWGFARVIAKNESSTTEVYRSAISIGFNPTYGNNFKTVEPHFIANKDSPERTASICRETLLRDFYGDTIRLSVIGYLRPELPFEGLEKLTQAIKNDIVNSERLCDESNEVTLCEKEWVSGNFLP